MATDDTAGPVSGGQRIAELDVLRGIALLGVLIVNFVAFAGDGVVATEAQLAALPTATIDRTLFEAVRVLVGDKANTVFATLFGLGFYLQMKRGEGRPGFEKRYARRLGWLLLFGLLNALFLWVWDILNVYAVAGFGLLLMRHWRTRSLVVFGLIAACYSDKLQEGLLAAMGIKLIPDALYEDPAILQRQVLVLGDDYPAIVAGFAQWSLDEWILGGTLFAWLIYALGRFALGAAIGRSGILDDISRFVPMLRRVAVVAIPLGLLAGLGIRLITSGAWQPLGDNDHLEGIANMLRSPAALLLSAGYCSGIVVALQAAWGQRLFGMFAAVGRMALTNYLVQGFLYAFVMFGVGPGLGLAGRIGTSAVLAICLGFFALQIGFSHWWLARYRFGPMEWLWRALTYGERPAMRRQAEPVPA